MNKSFIILLLLFCAACSTTQPRQQDLQSHWPTMPIQSDATSIRALQNITAQFLNRTEHFQSIIEIQPKSLRIILLNNSGQRLATITHIGGELFAETHVKLPAKLPLMQILETIQLIYFPADQLNAHLLAVQSNDTSTTKEIDKWQIKQQKLERTVFFQESLYARIVYTSVDPWNGKTEYHNKPYNYQFTIDSSLLP